MSDLFPDNPTHGMLFEQKNGVIYQYDATIKSWIKLATDNLTLKVVSPVSDGAMTAEDLRKLNRLVIPAPVSTIKGDKCEAPFKTGAIDMRGGDNFINVTGKANLQNIDQYGDAIGKEYPYQIHQHTFGFDFTLDIRQLITELETRGQIRLEGKRGPKGDKGQKGEDGINGILSGPPGDKGATGSAPQCELEIEPEVLDAQLKEGNTKVIVGASIKPNPIDARRYSLVFDRQTVGSLNNTATKFNIRNVDSTWVLAAGVNVDDNVTPDPIECGIPGQSGVAGSSSNTYTLYYMDIQPIMDSIHNKFLGEVQALKTGYEKSVSEWLQIMSDMFDEQKRALCCALERCISLTKSSQLRQHMESVAAAAVGRAKIVLHGRDSNQAVKISHTRPLKQLGNTDLCEGGPVFPQNPAADWRASTDNGTSTPTSTRLLIDPLAHRSSANANKIELGRGEYIATISKAEAVINGKHRANARIRFISDGQHKTSAFMDKGSYSTLAEAQSAYNGLSVRFKHDGGPVDFYIPSIDPSMTYGNLEITIDRAPERLVAIQPQRPMTVPESDCHITSAHLKYYERAWQRGSACGCVVEIAGQDYIVVRRSVGPDDSCGGGENLELECMEKHVEDGIPPAIAWPTFDGNSFVAIPKGNMYLTYNKELSDTVLAKFDNGDVSQKRGTIVKVLFPAR